LPDIAKYAQTRQSTTFSASLAARIELALDVATKKRERSEKGFPLRNLINRCSKTLWTNVETITLTAHGGYHVGWVFSLKFFA